MQIHGQCNYFGPRKRVHQLFHEDCPQHFKSILNMRNHHRNRKRDNWSENFIHPGAKHCSIQDVTRHKWRNGNQFFYTCSNRGGRRKLFFSESSRAPLNPFNIPSGQRKKLQKISVKFHLQHAKIRWQGPEIGRN